MRNHTWTIQPSIHEQKRGEAPMYAIGQKYRHLLTQEVVQIYFIYRHSQTNQEMIFDLVSAVADSDCSSAAELSDALRRPDRRKLRFWHVMEDTFKHYYDRA
ncbi:hypothetical protein [Paenibacillus sp. P22]|uniref:hypothetical protein n=1 Tax=Paenibacillus sp. P22 TaxID=483908 RepID=UPI00038F3E4E|nr:hypothetical protein [Paenibacillus sp. P22]CDN43999.1 hypothetical protein BN871_DZ_00030 [Paenibacillus sp. P22]